MLDLLIILFKYLFARFTPSSASDRLRRCGLFGQNTFFGGKIGICLSKIRQ